MFLFGVENRLDQAGGFSRPRPAYERRSTISTERTLAKWGGGIRHRESSSALIAWQIRFCGRL